MFEAVENYRPHVIAALGDAGTKGLTVKELRERINAGEEIIRRTLTLLLCAGKVRESFRYTPGARGAVPRVYALTQINDATLAVSPASASEQAVTE
ncbi:hypothetical protein [Corallococcus sp. AB045]|uniref:hypothetical protein n=1 Tax=Corallococcus sp. AB045 TaxID=2316719 RepID=UPI0018F6DA4D|nr:hypothetical protein [Corallococcus sp. AB045]